MKISKLALIALLGGALMAFGCSDDATESGGSGGDGGAGGEGGSGGGVGLACLEAGDAPEDRCANGTINPIEPCCDADLPPEQENACAGTESIDNPSECASGGSTVVHNLTVFAINGDCNVGYDLDGCNGISCDNGALATLEGLEAIDNGVAGLAPTIEAIPANLDGVDQAFADALCGETDGDSEMDGCQPEAIDQLVLEFAVDANVEANCATVTVSANGTAQDPVILNLSAPTDSGTVCASGTIGTIPLEIAGTSGQLDNAVIRMTVSNDGFSDGVLGATVGGDTAVAIAEAINPAAASVVATTFDIATSLAGDVTADCDALSGTYDIGGVAIPAE